MSGLGLEDVEHLEDVENDGGPNPEICVIIITTHPLPLHVQQHLRSQPEPRPASRIPLPDPDLTRIDGGVLYTYVSTSSEAKLTTTTCGAA